MSIDLRSPTQDDLARLQECLRNDDFHALQDPEWWNRCDGELYVFHDREGNRVWVRAERVLRLSIQHDQASPKIALGKILIHGLNFIRKQASEKLFTEIVFHSVAEQLIGFMQKKFGFLPVKDNFSVLLAKPQKSNGMVN